MAQLNPGDQSKKPEQMKLSQVQFAESKSTVASETPQEDAGTRLNQKSRAPIAHELAKKQKEISIAEFFERNKHILGYDSPTRALITAVKEGVDNSLDACEEAEILPEIILAIESVENAKDEYRFAGDYG